MRGRARRSRTHFLPVIVAVLACLCFGKPVVAYGKEFSCRDRTLKDYNSIFGDLPHNRLPQTKGLGFGPKDLVLRTPSSTLVEGAPVQYTLALDRPLLGDGRLARPALLGWEILLRVDAVDGSGRPLDRSVKQRWNLKQLRYPEKSFGIERGRGLYRVTLLFKDQQGSKLGILRQFLQILPVREMVGIALRNDSKFGLGESGVARLENWGTTEVLLPVGAGLSVEHFEGEEWVEVVNDESPSAIFEDPEFLPRGRASGCSFFEIPTTAAPGAYRLSTIVASELGGRRRVSRAFTVLP